MDNNHINTQSTLNPEPTIPPQPEPFSSAQLTSTTPTVPPSPNPIPPIAVSPAPQPTFGSPSSDTTSAGKISFSIKGIIATCANALGVICFFIPWVSAMSRSANGIETMSADVNYGYLGLTTLILLTVSATISALNSTHKFTKHHKIAISVISGIAAILALILTVKIANEIGEYVGVGAGLIILIISGVVAAVSPWLPIKES